MLFNTVDFAIFLPSVFLIYWIVPIENLRLKNIVIVLASYFFYANWDWRFLSLIILSTVLDFFVGIRLNKEQSQQKRKMWLWLSITVNLGILGFFKYFHFFVDNFVYVFKLFGQDLHVSTLQIILPVGISFYTFQTMSYTIDIFRKQLKPTKDFLTFAAFVSFFPQLVAGPIERAGNLLPQFNYKKEFNYAYAVDGLRQILWGLFKKVVIADNCALIVDNIFNHSGDMSGSTLLLGALFFSFQIYGDFSGYSDIAIGTSRLFGIQLKQNFAFPYFSRNIAEFWRRWHISLSTWFRDYVYIPLGGSRGTKHQTIRNVFIVFIVSGFWHGANWTFIAWGTLHALYFLPLLLNSKNRNYLNDISEGRQFPSFLEFCQIITTYFLVVLAWILFRADNLGLALQYFSAIFSKSLFTIPHFEGLKDAFYTVIFIVFFIVIEWKGRNDKYGLERIALQQSRFLRWSFYMLLVVSILWYNGKEQAFIYFQF